MADTIEAGDYVECMDDRHGDRFLSNGLTYKVVNVVRVGRDGSMTMYVLEGSAVLWISTRFKRVKGCDGL